MEIKLETGTEMDFPNYNGTSQIPNVARLNVCDSDDMKHFLKSKHYKTLFEYIKDVADELKSYSMEIKLETGTEMDFPNYHGTSQIPNVARLNVCDSDEMKHFLKSKHYKTLFQYIKDVADELPQRQAFYTINLEDILWKVQEWKQFLPRVEIFYAVKVNTDPIVLTLLVKLGLSFDCASQGEIKVVLEAEGSPKNIIFAHTVKTEEELKFSSEIGVELMTFDDEEELLKIHRVYPNAKLLIRIVPTKISCHYDLSNKFGCTEKDALKLIKLAYQININVVGISFHVGGLCNDSLSYTSTIETSRRLFDAARDIGFNFTILDIGGGFYGSFEKQHIFYEMAEGINKSLKEYFPNNEIRIIAEPGTYIVASAANLVSTVIGKRCSDNAADGKPKRSYYINDGVFGSFSQTFYDYDMKPTILVSESEVESRPKHVSRIYGQTCCSDDVIMENVILPDLKIGERITWSNMGAYCLGVSSTFCGVPLPVSKYVFVHKERLNMDWIASKQTISNFLKKYVTFVGCTEDDI